MTERTWADDVVALREAEAELDALAAEVERLRGAAQLAIEYAERNCGPCEANGIAYPHMVCDECWAAEIQSLLGEALAELDAGERR